MSFAQPLWLWLGLLAPLELLLSLRRERAARASLLALCPPGERRALEARRRLLGPLAALGGALCLLALSLLLARPSWGSAAELVETEGLEVAIVLDVSRSMSAEDLSPPGPGLPGSRLEVAKSFARLALGRAPGASFSLVAVKGEALLLVPMTDDLDALETGLDWAEPGAMSAAGTDLGAGIDAALASFSPLAGQGRLIVLLSDGGDLGGRARAAALRARQRGLRIIAVGFGGDSPVTVPGPEGRPLGDGKGGSLRVGRDAELLRALARATGGAYLEGSEASALGSLSQELALEGRGGSRLVERPLDRGPLFALLALLFLLLRLGSSFLAEGPGLRGRPGLPRGPRP